VRRVSGFKFQVSGFEFQVSGFRFQGGWRVVANVCDYFGENGVCDLNGLPT